MMVVVQIIKVERSIPLCVKCASCLESDRVCVVRRLYDMNRLPFCCYGFYQFGLLASAVCSLLTATSLRTDHLISLLSTALPQNWLMLISSTSTIICDLTNTNIISVRASLFEHVIYSCTSLRWQLCSPV